MDIIEAFIDSPDGMSLQADTKKFWSRMGPDDVEAAKDVRDPFTRFMVSKTSDNKLLLKADTGKYVTLWGSERYLKCAKTDADNWCEFTVYDAGDGLIALRGTEGLFVSRWGPQQLRAAKPGVDNFCKFKPGYGNLLDPKFEIIDVTIDSDFDDFTYTPESVDKTIFINRGSYPIDQTVKMTYSKTETQTTTWNHSWSFGAKMEHKSGVPGVAQSEFSINVSVGGGVGDSSSVKTTTQFTRSHTVHAQTNKKTTVDLIAKKVLNAPVNFTATIKRTDADGSTNTFKEKGTWSGVLYSRVETSTTEEDIDEYSYTD